MKRALVSAGAVIFAFVVFSVPAHAQYGTVSGTCTDAQGAPIVDAQIVYHNQDNGRQYKLKTNKKGSYFSLGLEPGQYTVTLSKDGQTLDTQKNVHVDIGENPYDVNLKRLKEQSIQDTAKKEGVSAEEVKRQQEAAEKAQQHNTAIKGVNEKLKAAIALMDAQPPNYDQAISLLSEAKEMAPNEDVVWGDLGSAYLDSAKTQTDPTEKTKRDTEAYTDFQKAIDLKTGASSAPAPATGQTAPTSAPAAPAKPATPADAERLAGYYANLGSAAARLSKNDEAAQDFQKAADLDPAKAGNYYYNLGVVLHNTAKNNDDRKAAAAAFDKAIAADPTKAEAYYLKGTELFGLSSTDSAGKIVAPQGTAEAFQKYLELEPNGTHAVDVKAMLAALGSPVETGFGKKSTKKK